jgi:hypothetical protein
LFLAGAKLLETEILFKGGPQVYVHLDLLEYTKTFPGLIPSMQKEPAIMREFQEVFLLVAAMVYVPGRTRNIVTICSWHA